MDVLSGKIISLSYKNNKGKMLLSRGEHAGKKITFVAPFELKPFLKLRMFISIKGQWVKNQFHVEDIKNITHELSPEDMGILTMLVPGLASDCISNAIKVMGCSNLWGLVKNIKEIDGYIDLLADKVGDEQAVAIVKILDEVTRDSDCYNVSKLFERHNTGLDFTHAVLITDRLHNRASRNGMSVAQLIQNYPWVLPQVFGQTGLLAAEKIARDTAQYLPVNACKARIFVKLISDLNRGHSYTPYNHLWAALSHDGFSSQVISQALMPISLDAADNNKKGYYIPEPKKYSEQLTNDFISEGHDEEAAEKLSKAVYLPGVYWSEIKGAEKLAKVLTTKGFAFDEKEIKRRMKKYSDVKLDDDQLAIAEKLCNNKVTVVTGQAGSGKTTAIKALIKALQDIICEQVPVLAPTGTAAQLVGAKTGADFGTIHRWSRISIGDDDYAVGTSELSSMEDTKDVPVVVVDEMSMATVTMLYRLLHIVKPNARFLFVGDPGQLPSIGAGVFDELIAIAKMNQDNMALVELKGSYRNNDDIVRNALRVRNGEVIDRALSCVELIESEKKDEIIQNTIKVVEGLLSQGVKWEDIIVLGSTRTKGVGVDVLNVELRNKFGKPSTEHGFAVGDPVIAIRNDYADKYVPRGLSSARKSVWMKLVSVRQDRPTIYNGTRGIITDCFEKDGSQYFTVMYSTPEGEKYAKYGADEIGFYIELAYATTVHKIQGNQAKYIIYAGNTEMSRELLYTVFTRSTGKVWLIGPEVVWDKAVTKHREKLRTKFRYRVLDAIEQRKSILFDLSELDLAAFEIAVAQY